MLFGLRAVRRFSSQQSYYDTLGLLPSATSEQVKVQYYKLAKMYHPDVNPHQVEKFKAINKAYEALKDSNAKARYDSQQQAGQGEATTSYTYRNYHYGRTREEDFKKAYEHFKTQQQQQYQYTANSQESFSGQQSENPDLRSKPDYRGGAYLQLMTVFFLGMSMFVFADILSIAFSPKEVVLYDEKTGKMYKTSQEQFKQMQQEKQKNKDFQQFRSEIMKRQQEQLRQQRLQSLVGE